MKAMILAAGLGTRLRPLTDITPKALMPVANQPILAHVVEVLKTNGVSQIVVNAHHQYPKIVDYLDGGRPFGIEIDVRLEPEILGTGGGIRNTLDFWDNAPFIVINGDVLTNINLRAAYEQHRRSGVLATLILHDCEPFNQIRTDAQGYITEIASNNMAGRLAFTGIHVMDPELLSYIPDGEFSNIIDCYRQLIRRGKMVSSFLSKGHQWHDIGTVNTYVKANRELMGEKAFLVGPGSHVHNSVKFEEWAVVGEKSDLGKDVEIRRSILWEGVQVKKGIKVVDSIVTAFRVVNHDLIGKIY